MCTLANHDCHTGSDWPITVISVISDWHANDMPYTYIYWPRASGPWVMSNPEVVSSVDDVRTMLGWTVNRPIRGERNAKEINKLSEGTANQISVVKLEQLQ